MNVYGIIDQVTVIKSAEVDSFAKAGPGPGPGPGAGPGAAVAADFLVEATTRDTTN